MDSCNHPDNKLYVGSPDSSADRVVRLKMDNGEIMVSFPAEAKGFSPFFFFKTPRRVLLVLSSGGGGGGGGGVGF